MNSQTTISETDARTDAAARDVASRYCHGEMSEASARSTIIELALSSPITSAAISAIMNRLGPCPSHQRRHEITVDTVSDILIRMIMGTADSPPHLALNQIANGVRFTTCLRKLLYGRSMDIACARVYARERRMDDAYDLDEEAMYASAEVDSIERANVEKLWQQFLGEKAVTDAAQRPFLDEWVLAELLGVRPLSRPSPAVQRALVDVPAPDVRDALKETLSGGDIDPRLKDALGAMVEGHSPSERDDLLAVPDIALDRFITAALTPHTTICGKDMKALRDIALDFARANSSPTASASERNVTGMVNAWNNARAATLRRRGVGVEFKDAARREIENENFRSAVDVAVRHGYTAFGTTPTRVSQTLERLYATMTNERRRSHLVQAS